MKVYTDEMSLGVAVSNDKKTIAIFDLNEGEVPFEIYRGGNWESFDFESAPEEVTSFLDKANEILAEGQDETLDELPEEIKEVLKGHVPEEFFEVPELEEE